MIIIAHRGNLNGPNPKLENKPSYLKKAMDLGYDVETDVWLIDGKLFLGHDEPQYETTKEFIHTGRMWCHAKNIAALEYMLEHEIHCFWHEADSYVVTSYGFAWAFPGQPGTNKTITVMPEIAVGLDVSSFLGICTDECLKYKHLSTTIV